MQKRPYAFDPLFTNMIAAGEAGGILDTILQRLSTFIEKQAKLVVAGAVRDDLSDRGPQHRGHRRRPSSWSRSCRRSRTCSEGLNATLPFIDARGHLVQ